MVSFLAEEAHWRGREDTKKCIEIDELEMKVYWPKWRQEKQKKRKKE